MGNNYPRGGAGVIHVLDDQTVNATATVNSTNGGYFFEGSSGESFSVWATVVSATGTPDVNIFIDISPLTEKIAYNSTDTSLYVPHKMVDALATETAMQGPYHANNNADNKVHLDYPFCQWRIRVVGDGANPADTVVNVWVCQFN